MMGGVIPYGPPASGKDTITAALQKIDPRYKLFARLKAGPGRTTGYRMTTEAEIDVLRAAGDVVWENHRYGAVYVVDRPELVERLADHIPVLHLGQLQAIDAVVQATPTARWLVVYLWCPRAVAATRIEARGTGDTSARMHAWDETEPAPGADLSIDTAKVLPADAAHAIDQRLGHRVA